MSDEMGMTTERRSLNRVTVRVPLLDEAVLELEAFIENGALIRTTLKRRRSRTSCDADDPSLLVMGRFGLTNLRAAVEMLHDEVKRELGVNWETAEGEG